MMKERLISVKNICQKAHLQNTYKDVYVRLRAWDSSLLLPDTGWESELQGF